MPWPETTSHWNLNSIELGILFVAWFDVALSTNEATLVIQEPHLLLRRPSVVQVPIVQILEEDPISHPKMPVGHHFPVRLMCRGKKRKKDDETIVSDQRQGFRYYVCDIEGYYYYTRDTDMNRRSAVNINSRGNYLVVVNNQHVVWFHLYILCSKYYMLVQSTKLEWW